MENISSRKYDYIFTGAGCAGLSLLMHLIHSGKFSDKKILLIDKSSKTDNDRTWCFWETRPGLFESIVYKQWDAVSFHADEVSRLLDIAPYRYKMIRGIDFYWYCFDIIKQQGNIEILNAQVESINSSQNSVAAGGETFYADYIFNSILFDKPVLKKGEFYLQQHFKGWLIETAMPVFDPARATLMDFRVSQQHGTTFVYVLPVSATVAMVEYTLFTSQLLKPEQYDEGLREYISRFIPSAYEVIERETGVIPMTNHSFTRYEGDVVNIGSAGGQTKPSSGYTFYFIQQHSRAITDSLILTGKPFIPPLHSRRFKYYDSVFLNVLATHKLRGKRVFADMFRSNKPKHIMEFLNNESSLATDLKIISSLPLFPFLKAGIQEIV
ncbi:MAG TPA: lycopene cyclase family protein [Chitinophagaceae bacterium]